MKTFILTLTFLLALSGLTNAQTIMNFDQAQSPYLVVKTNNPIMSRMPLKSTSVDVNMSGSIAHVKVTQFYANESQIPLDATYIFKGSDQMMVHELHISTSDRRVSPVVSNKTEPITSAGLNSLPSNSLQVDIQRIAPSDQLKVELHYTEAITFQEKMRNALATNTQANARSFEGVYRFIYPRLIGTQYQNPLNFDTNAPVKYDNESTSFGIQINLQSEVPIQKISSPSHAIRSQSQQPNSRYILYSELANFSLGRDFELDCLLGSEQIEAGMVLYTPEFKRNTLLPNENYFSLLIQPPLVSNNAQNLPQEYVFFVDVSPTMHGQPLETTKDLISDLVGQLNPNDLFNVFLYDYSNKMLSLNSVNPDFNNTNLSRALHLIDTERNGKDTKLLVALNKALAMPNAGTHRRNFIIVSDGNFHIDQSALDLIRQNLTKANFFTFGIGEANDLHTLHDLAQVSLRKPFIVSNIAQSKEVRVNFVEYIRSPVLSEIQLNAQGLELYDLELVPQQNNFGAVHLPDLFAGEPLVISGKYRGNSQAGRVQIQAQMGNQTFVKQVNPQFSNQEGIRYLWARKRVEHLEAYRRLLGNNDLNDLNRKQEIQDLGINHHLITSLTTLKDNVRGGSGLAPRGVSVQSGSFVAQQARPYMNIPPRPSVGKASRIDVNKPKLNPILSPKTKTLDIKKPLGGNPRSLTTQPRPLVPTGEKIYKVHRVQAGEKINGIAQKYGVTISDIRKWSKMHGSEVFEGQMLTLYVDRTRLRKRYHEVKEYESLYKIARHCGVTVGEIKEWNDLVNHKLSIEQELLIYDLIP